MFFLFKNSIRKVVYLWVLKKYTEKVSAGQCFALIHEVPYNTEPISVEIVFHRVVNLLLAQKNSFEYMCK